MVEVYRPRHIVLKEWFYEKPFGEKGEPLLPPEKAELKLQELEEELMTNPRPAANESLSIRFEADIREGKEGFVVQKVLTRIYPEGSLDD